MYKEIQNGAVAKSYMRKGFRIYEEMRKYLAIWEVAESHMWLCNCSILNFLICEENFLFFFISVEWQRGGFLALTVTVSTPLCTAGWFVFNIEISTLYATLVFG